MSNQGGIELSGNIPLGPAANNPVPPLNNPLAAPQVPNQANPANPSGAQNNGANSQQQPAEENKIEAPVQSQMELLSDQNPQLVRSHLLPNNDRYILEQELMQPLTAGSGLLGTGLVDLEALKRQKCDIHLQQKLHKNTDMLNNLRLDGIYVDDPEVYQKFTDINVQKLEERLLKNGQNEFFKINGELKLDNDILDDDLTRPADLAFDQTTAFQTTEINAILSDRLHSFKKRYYRLDIILGNMKLFNCKNILSEEEKLAIKLKEEFQDYETRISLCMIPFYIERHAFISQEYNNKLENQQRGVAIPQSELDFLVKTREEVERSLEKEKLEVNRMANSLYSLWTKILEERERKTFRTTNIELKVHKQMEETGEDQLLDIKYPNNSITPEDKLSSSERSRQTRIKRLQVYAVLLINDRKVSKTNKSNCNWPNLNFQIKEMFQVHVFTIPSSIKVELVLCDGFSETVVDVVKVEVPGQHVKSLTCSCPLIQKVPFSKVGYEKSKVAKKYIDQSYKPDGELSEAQKKKLQGAQDKKEKQEQLKKETDILGEVFIKAEWKGSGPKMPPIRSENLFNKPLLLKNRRQYTQEQEYMMLLKQLYIDVNDPRNQQIIKVLRETKNEFLVALLGQDSKNVMNETQPFRHKLLQARAKDPAGFGKVFIPLLEGELIDSVRSSFYLEQLEQLFRNEAYLIHLTKMVSKQKDANEEGNQDELDNLFNLMDLDTLRRRQLIFDQIKERQQYHQNEATKGSTTYRSVVEEEEFSYDTNFLVSISEKLFMKGRKLKPLVKAKPAQNLEAFSECKIVVHVVKGENVPIRKDLIEQYEALKDQDFGGGGQKQGRVHRPTANMPPNLTGDPNYDREDGIEDDRQNRAVKTKQQLNNTPQVETYVEIKVQYHEKYSILKTTNVDEGTMPRWNEILDFPLDSQNSEGFTQKELMNSKTVIIATLFDKQTYQSVREGERVSLDEHRFLGSVTIPLLTLLTNQGKTDFNFRLDRPCCLPNYRVLDDEIYFMNAESLAKQRKMENEQPPTYLNLSITLEPNIELPVENSEYTYPGFEEQKMLDDGARWLSERQRSCSFKNYNIKLFGENIQGVSVLLSRYLTPQEPPEEVLDLKKNPQDKYAIERAARFVSMIPFIEDLRLFQDMPDLYATTQEFFDLGGGDYEEHAILLANYFTYIDKTQGRDFKTFVVFGSGFPAGHMVYVMRKRSINEGSFEIWDPISGQCYHYQSVIEQNKFCGIKVGKSSHLDIRLTDPICPLMQLHTVVSSENVYVNMQKTDYPILMDFNFSNVAKWKRFFTEDTTQVTCQPLVLYSKPKEHTEVIESRIQKYLVEMFQEERIKRVRKTTKWAVTANEELRRILIDCEEWSKMARHGGIDSDLLDADRKGANENIKISGISQQLDQIAQQDSNKRVWGFPLNTTFTSLENLWKMVHTTKMHAVNRQDVEFGLAVYIEAYPANILSVWVYLAAFVDVSIENLYQQQ